MATLPTQYQWLNNVGVLPKTIQVALKYLGTQEIVGKGSNKTILTWRDMLNQSGVVITGYSDDDIPWCGLFAAIVTLEAGKEVVKNPLWARNWQNFGVQSQKASLGDILVFVRDGGGHVGFYIGEDKTAYHVLGGNQSNKVCFTRILKSRCVAVRSPIYNIRPPSAKPYILAAAGSISKNEG